MKKTIILLLIVCIFIASCDVNLDVVIPESAVIKKILIYSVDIDDPYNGVLDTEERTLLRTITSKSTIEDVLELVKYICKPTSAKFNQTNKPRFIVELYSQEEREMVFWYGKEEISVLTKPVSPKNASHAYKASAEEIEALNNKLWNYSIKNEL